MVFTGGLVRLVADFRPAGGLSLALREVGGVAVVFRTGGVLRVGFNAGGFFTGAFVVLAVLAGSGFFAWALTDGVANMTANPAMAKTTHNLA